MENKRNRDRMVQICNTMRKKVILVLSLLLTFSTWRFQHANAPPAKLKNIFVKTLKRSTKI